MALTKAQLVDALFDQLKLTKKDAQGFVELFFEELQQQLERGQSVSLSGFGNFELRDKRARQGRNPKTGENAIIEARRVVVFRPGQKMRYRVSPR